MTQSEFLAALIGNLWIEKGALLEEIARLRARVAELEKAPAEAP